MSSEAADFLINKLSEEDCRVLWEKLLVSPLQMLGGTTGIFDLIADFAGFILLGNHMASTLQGIIGPLEYAINDAVITAGYHHVFNHSYVRRDSEDF